MRKEDLPLWIRHSSLTDLTRARIPGARRRTTQVSTTPAAGSVPGDSLIALVKC